MTNQINYKEVLEDCLLYCKEQNGLPYCKNCGLEDVMIKGLISQARHEAIAEYKSQLKLYGYGQQVEDFEVERNQNLATLTKLQGERLPTN